MVFILKIDKEEARRKEYYEDLENYFPTKLEELFISQEYTNCIECNCKTPYIFSQRNDVNGIYCDTCYNHLKKGYKVIPVGKR